MKWTGEGAEQSHFMWKKKKKIDTFLQLRLSALWCQQRGGNITGRRRHGKEC